MLYVYIYRLLSVLCFTFASIIDLMGRISDFHEKEDAEWICWCISSFLILVGRCVVYILLLSRLCGSFKDTKYAVSDIVCAALYGLIVLFGVIETTRIIMAVNFYYVRNADEDNSSDDIAFYNSVVLIRILSGVVGFVLSVILIYTFVKKLAHMAALVKLTTFICYIIYILSIYISVSIFI